MTSCHKFKTLFLYFYNAFGLQVLQDYNLLRGAPLGGASLIYRGLRFLKNDRREAQVFLENIEGLVGVERGGGIHKMGWVSRERGVGVSTTFRL